MIDGRGRGRVLVRCAIGWGMGGGGGWGAGDLEAQEGCMAEVVWVGEAAVCARMVQGPLLGVGGCAVETRRRWKG